MFSRFQRLFMNKLIQFFKDGYSYKEWTCMKITIILVWLKLVIKILLKYNTITMPSGLCHYVPCNFLMSNPIKLFLFSICIFLSFLYLSEKKMIWATLGIFILSVFICTLEESNGVLKRNSLFSLVFSAQFFSYFFSKIKVFPAFEINRIQFSIQAIAAGYTLSAISKLTNSGFDWFLNSKLVTLQVLKSSYFGYADYNDLNFINHGSKIVEILQTYPVVISVCLFITLLLESFAVISAIGKQAAFFYGTLLLVMHIGIYLVLNIKIDSFIYPMLIFFINPLFLLISSLKFVSNSFLNRSVFL